MSAGPKLLCVEPWGQRSELIEAYVDQLRPHVEGDSSALILLTAHSLPMQVIRSGDKYADQFEAAVSLVESRLGRKVQFCYQSQGAVEGDWLGPDLVTTLKKAASDGVKRVVLSPAGFLTEHVETLYDLDVECKQLAESLGLELYRIPALRTHPLLIKALAGAVSDVLLKA